jgi:hypothetical protein
MMIDSSVVPMILLPLCYGHDTGDDSKQLCKADQSVLLLNLLDIM